MKHCSCVSHKLTNFHPQILQPTRITNHTATLINDIFLNSKRETFTISGNIIYDLTDHLPNFLIIKNYSCLPNDIKLYKRDFSNFNEAAFIQECQFVNWEEVVTTFSDVNIRFSGVKVWNALEPDIKLLSMSAFKARLKSSLISKY